MPGLDGLRALAVIAVIAYHLGLAWAPGGLLGVGVFFTLSGYLITDLLLAQWSTGRRQLADFWLRRARRLLPGLFLMLVVVTVWVSVADRSQLADLRGQVAASVVYVSNWWQISQHLSYFARFGPPSPLNHLWSLAVEEQFYLIWPWVLLLGVHFVTERRRPIPVRPRLAGLTLLLAAASAIEMAVLYHPTFDPSRVYDGTDTRAFALLIGAALAMVWPSRALTTRVTSPARGILDGLGVVGLLTIALLVWRTNQYSAFPYKGGIVLLSVATAFVVAALSHPATRLGRALGWSPLRWLGVRSYGIYLWQVPVIVLTTPTPNPGLQPLRAVLQVAAIIFLAALSWRYVEEPIRRGAIGRLWAQGKAAGWRPLSLPGSARAALTATAVVLVLAAVGLAGVNPPTLVTSALAKIRVGPASQATQLAATTSGGAGRRERPRGSTAHPRPGSTAHPRPGSTTSSGRASTTSPGRAPTPVTVPVKVSTRTSCRAVVHIGDSTSEGLDSSDYLPDPAQRISAQYARVGVTDVHLEITGATSIVETLPGAINAYEVARGLAGDGYRGCWVIALGTNDTADLAVGSSVGLSARIKRMMSVIGNQPVMWVNVKSLVGSGPYSESNMQAWDSALVHACGTYPNMRVFDWASAVRDNWFINDGIHYTSPGYAARSLLIANALAKAFPATAEPPPSSCVVEVKSRSVRVLDVGP
jgi:peptidoglycan/LPS O-acetylase OafA/YrhL